MSDEGVGIRVLAALEASGALPDAVELIDLGTGGLRLLHETADREKLVFIDCAFMGEAPGTVRRFTPDEVRSVKAGMRGSVHEGDLLSNLALARRMGRCPDDVVIFGIEPASVDPGLELTDALASRVEDYARRVREEIGGGDA
jgi:hydrogenase maturation protease